MSEKNVLNGVISDEDLRALQDRNVIRAQLLKEQMGEKWLLNEANRVSRLKTKGRKRKDERV